MKLSVTCLVHYSPERAAAMLAPLRRLDPEVVLAVDDRAKPEWIEGYRQLADQVITIEFPGMFSKTATWLTQQCSGNWILILHDDEVPSAGLVDEIAETIESGAVTHAWVRRWWIYPDSAHWIDEWPWRPDYHLRLVQNDQRLFRIPAVAHEPPQAIGPHVYLRSPLYHASLVFEDLPGRERKCARYDDMRPGLDCDGLPFNAAFLLPERRAVAPQLERVPEADAEIVRAFLGEQPVAPADRDRPGLLRHAPPAEVTPFDESRELAPSAYAAELTLLVGSAEMVVGRYRSFDLEVVNRSDETWPGGLEAKPQVRLAYRWIEPDGTAIEGLRTPLGAPLGPGMAALVPVAVLAPEAPGEYVLEIDLVNELVKWFDCGFRTTVTVASPPEMS